MICIYTIHSQNRLRNEHFEAITAYGARCTERSVRVKLMDFQICTLSQCNKIIIVCHCSVECVPKAIILLRQYHVCQLAGRLMTILNVAKVMA